MHHSPAGLIYEKGMLVLCVCGNLILCSRESILLWASAAFCGEICAC